MTRLNHSTRIVNSDCLLVDCCAGIVLRPLKSARFEYICDVDNLGVLAGEPVLISLNATAKQCGLKRKTLYNWVENGKLREEHGLRRWGKRWRVEWVVFKECFDRGEFASCS